MSIEWFKASEATAAGYAAGERTLDGQAVDAGQLAVEIEGNGGAAAILQGTKSELFRFATDIIEATLIAEARDQDRKLRLQAMQAAEAAGKVAGYYEYTPTVDIVLTPEQAAAFKAGQAGWDLAGVQRDPDRDSPHPAAAGGMIRAYTMDERTAAAVKAGTIGGYSIGDTSLEDLGKEQQ